ncbi:hypothetical protein JHK86_016850 [Glycine max]|nr:hypothetical protein JHK86_016850 [Glycine max]
MLLPRKIYKVDLANILRTNFSISTPPLTSLFKEFSAFVIMLGLKVEIDFETKFGKTYLWDTEKLKCCRIQLGWTYRTYGFGKSSCERLVFHNDGWTRDFKYNKGIDSVVVVKKEDFDSCNINNPIQKMDGGDSTFQLSNSGLFYFISGNLNNCKNGQKLNIVLVMAVRQPIPKAAPPPASILPPQKIPATDLTSPAPTPTTDKSGSGRVGVSVGIVFMFIAFVGLV